MFGMEISCPTWTIEREPVALQVPNIACEDGGMKALSRAAGGRNIKFFFWCQVANGIDRG